MKFPIKLRNIFHHTLSTFLHYPGKVNSSNLLQITTEKNQNASRIWQKWNVYVVIRLTGDRRYCFLQHMLQVSAVRLHACTKTLATVVNSIASSMMLWSTLRHTCCTHCFSSSVSCTRDWYSRCWTRSRFCNQLAVRWSKIRWNERQHCSRSRTVSRVGVMEHCPVERRKIPLTPRASRVVAAVTGAHRGSKRRWS